MKSMSLIEAIIKHHLALRDDKKRVTNYMQRYMMYSVVTAMKLDDNSNDNFCAPLAYAPFFDDFLNEDDEEHVDQSVKFIKQFQS